MRSVRPVAVSAALVLGLACGGAIGPAPEPPPTPAPAAAAVVPAALDDEWVLLRPVGAHLGRVEGCEADAPRISVVDGALHVDWGQEAEVRPITAIAAVPGGYDLQTSGDGPPSAASVRFSVGVERLVAWSGSDVPEGETYVSVTRVDAYERVDEPEAACSVDGEPGHPEVGLPDAWHTREGACRALTVDRQTTPASLVLSDATGEVHRYTLWNRVKLGAALNLTVQDGEVWRGIRIAPETEGVRLTLPDEPPGAWAEGACP